MLIQSFCQDVWWKIPLQIAIALVSLYGIKKGEKYSLAYEEIVSSLPPSPIREGELIGVKCVVQSLLAALLICSCPWPSSRRRCQQTSPKLRYSESLKICWAKKGLGTAKGSESPVPRWGHRSPSPRFPGALDPTGPLGYSLEASGKAQRGGEVEKPAKVRPQVPSCPGQQYRGCSSDIPLQSSSLFFQRENLEQPKAG